MRSCFARVTPWLQAAKYIDAVMSQMPKPNGWNVADYAGDRAPDRAQRLLNRAAWDTFDAMSQVRRFAVAGLEEAARRGRRRGGLVIGALDETGQEKAGEAAGVKRQYMGCAGRSGERHQYGAYVVCAGKDRACSGRRAAVDPGGAHR